ncbi:vitamin K epoxide reductase family protein [Dietzia sp.]|uniref:vitamin K epoxide reductase family protein n=1 Tax=Dietzia sp. TaxID=1871616 RepID=UPI002FDB7E27
MASAAKHEDDGVGGEAVDTVDGTNVSAEPDERAGIFSPRTIGIILTIGSIVGIVAAFELTLDKIRILENPDFVPSCNFSILVSCKSVISSDQGQAFGFPNPIVGLIGFGITIAIGVALLAGVRFPRWYMVGTVLGLLFGIGWVQWFAYQTIFNIGYLCPWCMAVWTVMAPMFWYTLLHTLGRFTTAGWVRALRAWHLIPLVLWYLLVIGTILVHFWDFYWADFFTRLFS